MILLLIQKIVSLFLIMFLGYLLVKLKIFQSGDSKYFSSLSVYLVMPCSIINAFQVEFTKEVQSGLILAFAAAILVHLLLLVYVEIMQRFFHLEPVEKISIMYSNAGNLIIPLVSSILGPEWVIYSSAFLTVQTFLLWSHGKAVLCGEKSLNIKKVLKNVNMVTVLVGIVLLLLHIQLNGPVLTTVSSLASMIGPLAMLIAGMLIAGMDLLKMLKNRRLWMTAAFRLILTPLVVMILLKMIGSIAPVENAEKILMITLLATMTPSASTVVQQAQIYGGNADYASAINAITTLGCILTMPLMLILYQM